jgi:hypothetical protein
LDQENENEKRNASKSLYRHRHFFEITTFYDGLDIHCLKSVKNGYRQRVMAKHTAKKIPSPLLSPRAPLFMLIHIFHKR